MQTSIQIERPESMDKILEATVELVAEKGFEGASTKEIATRAGVSKGLLHYHYKSKEDILIEALGFVSQRIEADIRSHVEDGPPCVDQALKAADDLFTILTGNRTYLAFLTSTYATAIYNERLRDHLKEYSSLEHGLVKGILETTLGPYREHLFMPIERLAQIIQTNIVGLSFQSVLTLNQQELDERFEDIKRILVGALFTPFMNKE